MNSFDSFTLAPMSAGDIIDRAVRLYGRNFLALLRIVLAPSLVAYAGSILMSIGWRNATMSRGDERIVITVLLVLSGFLLWAIGKAAFYAVLGGSSRSLVAHFFEGKPILARDVYRAAWERVWSLIGATFMIGLLIMGAMMIAYFFVVTITMFFALLMATVLQKAPEWMQGAAAVIFAIVVAAAFAVSFLLIYGRVVYVPQILMVEGKGVFSSIGRSFSLAAGQLRRIAALILFWFYVGWSVLLLLFLPLGFVSDWVNPVRRRTVSVVQHRLANGDAVERDSAHADFHDRMHAALPGQPRSQRRLRRRAGGQSNARAAAGPAASLPSCASVGGARVDARASTTRLICALYPRTR